MTFGKSHLLKKYFAPLRLCEINFMQRRRDAKKTQNTFKFKGAKEWILSAGIVPAVRYIFRLTKTTAKKPCFSKSGDAASIRAKKPASSVFGNTIQIA
jgi:Zn/Cd-binding protein ZinT